MRTLDPCEYDINKNLSHDIKLTIVGRKMGSVAGDDDAGTPPTMELLRFLVVSNEIKTNNDPLLDEEANLYRKAFLRYEGSRLNRLASSNVFGKPHDPLGTPEKPLAKSSPADTRTPPHEPA